MFQEQGYFRMPWCTSLTWSSKGVFLFVMNLIPGQESTHTYAVLQLCDSLEDCICLCTFSGWATTTDGDYCLPGKEKREWIPEPLYYSSTLKQPWQWAVYNYIRGCSALSCNNRFCNSSKIYFTAVCAISATVVGLNPWYYWNIIGGDYL